LCSFSASGGQKPQFLANLDTLGAPVPTPFYRWGSNLVCYSRPEVYTEMPNFIWMPSLFRLPVAKNHNFGHILTFLGAPVPTPVTDEGQIWCPIADPQYTFTCEILSRSVYSVVLCRRKPPIFAVFWSSAFRRLTVILLYLTCRRFRENRVWTFVLSWTSHFACMRFLFPAVWWIKMQWILWWSFCIVVLLTADILTLL